MDRRIDLLGGLAEKERLKFTMPQLVHHKYRARLESILSVYSIIPSRDREGAVKNHSTINTARMPVWHSAASPQLV